MFKTVFNLYKSIVSLFKTEEAPKPSNLTGPVGPTGATGSFGEFVCATGSMRPFGARDLKEIQEKNKNDELLRAAEALDKLKELKKNPGDFSNDNIFDLKCEINKITNSPDYYKPTFTRLDLDEPSLHDGPVTIIEVEQVLKPSKEKVAKKISLTKKAKKVVKRPTKKTTSKKKK